MTAKAITMSLALCLLHLPGKMGIKNLLKRYYPLSAKLKTKINYRMVHNFINQ